MRIKKVSQTTPVTGQIVDGYSESKIDGYSADYINSLHTYSTTEVRIGTWIDGKPIYRKVFTITLSSSDKEKDKILSDSIINIDELVTLKGNLKNTFSNWFPMSNINPNGTLKNGIGLYYSNDSGICIRIGALYIDTNSKANVTIEYTKTTD